jgi:hypothetical protein
VRVISICSGLGWLLAGMVSDAASLSGEDIARQVDFVNRFGAVRNVSYGDRDHPVVVFSRAANGRTLVNTFERWRRNDYPEGDSVAARDLVAFRSGKLRGTGILVTDFSDRQQGRAYAIWLPSLRKVRRFSEPDPAESWGGSNLSYGDIYIRGPEDEAHELLGGGTFDECLGAVVLTEGERHRHLAGLPAADCGARGRPVYRLRSRPHRADLGYDERLVWVDAETFADYRSVYFRAGEVVKRIDKSWRSMGLDDPRAQYWVYWYARTEGGGQEGMAFVAPDAVRWNGDMDPDLWTERSLRRIRQ